MSINLNDTWNLNVWNIMVWAESSEETLKDLIKSPHSFVYRKAYVKRKLLSTGLFEDEWQDITKDVKKWGSVRYSVDVEKYGKVKLNNARLTLSNIDGKYNPNDNESSLWYGYADQQRSLVKIECGYKTLTKTFGGIWQENVYPDDTTVFKGIISGDMGVSDKNQITLNLKPMSQVFEDFPAILLDGFTSTGITASRFCEILRDQTDGSGSFIFRPFFDNTTSSFDINTTTNIYTNLNTSSANDLQQRSCWNVLERLAQAENYISYVTPLGQFKFTPKEVGSTTTYEFFGLGLVRNTEYGHTIKNIDKYGKRLTDYYSRVSVHWKNTLTSDAYQVTGTAFTVSGTNTAWNLGHRTYSIENYWINTSTVADAIAGSTFNEVSSLSEQLNFTTSLITHLNLLDKVKVSYDATDVSAVSEYWDYNDWDTELLWDSSKGDALILEATEFKLLSININLDTLETNFIAKQL